MQKGTVSKVSLHNVVYDHEKALRKHDHHWSDIVGQLNY